MPYLEVLLFFCIAIFTVVVILQWIYLQSRMQMLDERSYQNLILPTTKIPNTILQAFSVRALYPNPVRQADAIEKLNLQLKRAVFKEGEAQMSYEDVVVKSGTVAGTVDAMLLLALGSPSTEALWSSVANGGIQYVLVNGVTCRIVIPKLKVSEQVYSSFLNALASSSLPILKLKSLSIFLLHRVDSNLEGKLFFEGGTLPLPTAHIEGSMVGYRLVGFSLST